MRSSAGLVLLARLDADSSRPQRQPAVGAGRIVRSAGGRGSSVRKTSAFNLCCAVRGRNSHGLLKITAQRKTG